MELTTRTCKSERMNAQRMIARAMLIIGGLFWIFPAFGAQYAYKGATLGEAVTYALPFVLGIAFLFVVAMFYEYIAALMLVVGVVGLVGYLLITGPYELGTWLIAMIFLAAPMLLAASMFYFAARMQKICSLQEK